MLKMFLNKYSKGWLVPKNIVVGKKNQEWKFPAVRMAEEPQQVVVILFWCFTATSNTLLRQSLNLWLHPWDFGKISVSFTKFLSILPPILPISKILLNTQRIQTTNSIKEDFLIPHTETGLRWAFPHGTWTILHGANWTSVLVTQWTKTVSSVLFSNISLHTAGSS